jgi:hypothetical protein
LIEEKSKTKDFGDRAFWLFQMVRSAPLTWWEQRLEMSPQELLDWASKTDWKNPLYRGWYQALEHRPSADWAIALLEFPLKEKFYIDQTVLLKHLPLPQRENFTLQLLSQPETIQSSDPALVQFFLNSIPSDGTSLSTRASLDLVRILKNGLHDYKTYYYWQCDSLIELSCVVPDTVFNELCEGWDFTNSRVQSRSEQITKLTSIIEQRRNILRISEHLTT